MVVVVVVAAASSHTLATPSSPLSSTICCSNSINKTLAVTRRRALVFSSTVTLSPLFNFYNPNPTSAFALPEDELQQEEDRLVHLFQETSPPVVSIQDLEVANNPKSTSNEVLPIDDKNAKVEGKGSGFIWDKFGHIVLLIDAKGNSFFKEGKIVGYDPDYDLAVLKVDAEGYELKPIVLGTSHDLHVGQSCFAIGNPYGFEDTLTTGVVSGLGREMLLLMQGIQGGH